MFNNEEKRIYSLNLAAFIYSATGLMPEIKHENAKLFYCVFPENEQVSQAIRDYRQTGATVEIHRFLNCYGVIRDMIQVMRG